MDPPPSAAPRNGTNGDMDMNNTIDGSQLLFTPNSFFDKTIQDSAAQAESIVIINELLSYVDFYRHRAAEANLRKVVGNFYTPVEINSAKKLLVSSWRDALVDCALKAERRNSTSRAAHDVEVSDIVGILDFFDQKEMLRDAKFAAVNFDRVPKYGPEELNICAIADKQAELNAAVTGLSVRVNDQVCNDTLVSESKSIIQSLSQLETTLSNTIEKALDQFSHRLSNISTDLVQATYVRPPQPQPVQSSTATVTGYSTAGDTTDRTRNVVIFGVEDNTDQSTLRNVVTRAVSVAAGRDVTVDDAFRLGRRSSNGKPRPILVKLHSAWDRRMIVGGSWKLSSTEDFERIFIAPDDPKDVRNRKTLDRIVKKATADGKHVQVNSGVVSVDGVNVFSVETGYIRNDG